MKRRILAVLLCLCMAVSLLPAVAMAEGDPFVGATTIYVSDQGTGNGESKDTPTTLPAAFEQINAEETKDQELSFIISLTEDIEINGGVSSSFYLYYHNTTILGNGHSIKTNRPIVSSRQVKNSSGQYENLGTSVLNLGNPDGTDTLKLIATGSINSSIVGAVYDGVTHMYDGVTLTHGDKLAETDANIGNAIFSNHGGAFYMHGGVVENIYSTMSAPGAIQVYNATFEMTGGVIRNCKADRVGGAIFADKNAKVTVNGLIIGNCAEGSGGAIYLQNGSELTVGSSAVFENNVSNNNGGAICAFEGTGIIWGATFRNNSAAGFGGAIYVQDVKLSLSDCTIENNSAEDSGGGVYFTGNRTDLIALNISGATRIFNNQAPKADNLYLLELTPPENPGPGDLTEEYQTVLTVAGPLSNADNTAKIGVFMDNPGVFTQGYSSYCGEQDPNKYFASDDPANYHVQATEDKTEAMLAIGAVTNTITATAGPNGKITPDGEVKVEEGKDQTFTITPDTGYRIKDVLVDGVSVGAVASYTFKSVTDNHTIQVSFVKEDPVIPTSYTLRYETNGGNEIAPESGRTPWTKPYSQLPEPVRAGHTFLGWFYDSQLTQPVESDILVDRSMTLYAKWTGDVTDPGNSGVSDWLNTKDHAAYLKGYGNGIFGPDKSMTRAEAAQMFYNLLLEKNVPVTVSFTDVPADAWYAEAVNVLASLDILQGVGKNQFAPNRPITRTEFTAIAMRFTDGKVSGRNIFSDVSTSDWFYDEVVGSIQYGWINGYPDGTFRPNNTITRAEVTAIVNRMLGRSADKSYVAYHADQLQLFRDVAETHWAYYQIAEAANSHDYIQNGSGEEWTKIR